jgi:hypothetical protein
MLYQTDDEDEDDDDDDDVSEDINEEDTIGDESVAEVD